MTTMKFDLEAVRVRLSEAFRVLRAKGYFAKKNWKCCQSCGCAAMPQGTEKYVFYHAQDRQNLMDGEKFYLAWGGDSREIVAALREAGLLVEHDGSNSTRIAVLGADSEKWAATGYKVGQRVMVRGDRADSWRHAEIVAEKPYRGTAGFDVSNLDVDPHNPADSKGGWTYPAFMRPIPQDRPIIAIRPTSMKGQVLFQMWRPEDTFKPTVSLQMPQDYAEWLAKLAAADENGPGVR